MDRKMDKATLIYALSDNQSVKLCVYVADRSSTTLSWIVTKTLTKESIMLATFEYGIRLKFVRK